MKNVILFLAFLSVSNYNQMSAQVATERTLFFCCSPSGFCSDVGFERMTECQGSCRDFSRCQARSVQSFTTVTPTSMGAPVLATTTVAAVGQGVPVAASTVAPITQSLLPQSTITETRAINPGIVPFATTSPIVSGIAQPAPVAPVATGPVSNFVTATNDSGPLRTGSPTPGVR